MVYQIDDYYNSTKIFTYDKDFESYYFNLTETFEITEDVEDSNKFNEYLDKLIVKCDEKSDIMKSVNRLTHDNNFHSDYFVANELNERYEYANNKNNQIPVDKIKTTEIATYSTSLPIKGLLHADTKFLNKSLDYFNENGKSKEFTVLFDKTHNDFSEDKIKEMLLEENVLDNKLYNEFKGEYVKSENNLLEPFEQDFINAINEVNERAQSRSQGLER